MRSKIVSTILGLVGGNLLLGFFAVMGFFFSSLFLPSGWQVSYNLGKFDEGSGFIEKTTTAVIGLGALVSEEALYYTLFRDANGDVLDGSEDSYELHFSRKELPQVDGFWSLTMYGKDSFLVPNIANRFAIGDRTDDLLYNKDGSLDVVVSFRKPKKLGVNWLPAPDDEFSMTLRAYLPGERMRQQKWLPPIVGKQSIPTSEEL